MRKIIVASHDKLADGMVKTLKFIGGERDNLFPLSAYGDNKPIDDQIKEIMAKVSEKDELVILTDMVGGSVNQKFFSFKDRPNTHIISGINLPLALSIVLQPEEDLLTADRIKELIKEGKDQVIYVNDYSVEVSEDDE
ncbi:PTS sugar transporter subunit IIA [Clostridium arbusti]|uniref:PTS sugar transporter subunit IIA n=1 Tax=Clostridium arbusti TaxID=1137848 RepID=UPI0002897EAA|nr:PTS N-acetylglucosamine transporter subunit IIBC [Clostridium arbusti]